jgi:hypothetical protein
LLLLYWTTKVAMTTIVILFFKIRRSWLAPLWDINAVILRLQLFTVIYSYFFTCINVLSFSVNSTHASNIFSAISNMQPNNNELKRLSQQQRGYVIGIVCLFFFQYNLYDVVQIKQTMSIIIITIVDTPNQNGSRFMYNVVLILRITVYASTWLLLNLVSDKKCYAKELRTKYINVSHKITFFSEIKLHCCYNIHIFVLNKF